VASYVTEAVVTGARRYGEADRLVTLISPDRGRFTAIAKSARKPKSSLRGVTEPFVRAKFELAEAKTLDIIRQAEAIDIHLGIRDSWKRLQMAGHVAEIANSVTDERFPDVDLYEILNDALDGISAGDESSVMRFKVGILEHMGIFPDLSGCSRCGVERVRGSVHLDTQGHGFLCNDCAKEMHIHKPYPMKVLRILHVYRNGDINEHAENAELMEAADELVTLLLQSFLQHGFRTSKGMKQARAGYKKDKAQPVGDDIKS
jgi:DNA repair protein RecO (recombination protein O)